MHTSSNADRRAARSGGIALPLPLLFALSLVVAMGLLAGALLWQGWTAGRDMLFAATRDRAIGMGRLIAQRVETRVSPASQALGYLASGLLPGAGSETSGPARLDGLKAMFAGMPYISAITVSGTKGGFFMIQRLATDRPDSFGGPPGTVFVVQRITPADGAVPARGSLHFYDANLSLLAGREDGPTDFDPRTRDWYRHAPAVPDQYLSPPYRFYASGDLGVTLSERTGTDDLVVGLDMTLAELGAALTELKPSGEARMAVLTSGGDVLADTEGVGSSGVPQLSPVLGAILDQDVPEGQSVSVRVEGQTWFGLRLPLASRLSERNVLVLAIPERELLAGLRRGLNTQLMLAAAITAALLLAGWVVGHHLGRGLSELADQARRMTRFDFSRPARVGSLIREIDDFHAVLDSVSGTIRDFLASSALIASEERLDRMLAEVLARTVKGTACLRGTVYLADEAGGRLVREAEMAAAGAPPDGLPADLPLSVAVRGEELPMTLPPGTGRLAVPLDSRGGQPLGLLILTHGEDAAHQNEEFVAFVHKLSGLLAVSIETRRLIEDQRRLLDGFIRLIADAIDAKSPYTGAHCRRVPELATRIVDRLDAETEGAYRDFHLGPSEREAFTLGAWLHDCGKVTSAEHIIDKATKLEAVTNRIHEIRTRFEVLHRDATIAHLERLRAGGDPAASAARLAGEHGRLADDFAFVAVSNVGGEFMSDAALDRLRAIAGRTWWRHFDDRIGLSAAEEARLAGQPAPALPAAEPLLADRPEQVIPWDDARRPPVEKGDAANRYGFDMRLPANRQNLGELYNLSIRRGTLNDEERFAVNDHVVQTYIMLKRLPWPAGLGRVPEIAATHHERMDGTGYPRRIGADSLDVTERVMALADVFEALTASDRPYKRAKTLSEALGIMVTMATQGHLDPALMRYFLFSGVWRDYATDFLAPGQSDPVDVPGLAARLAPSA